MTVAERAAATVSVVVCAYTSDRDRALLEAVESLRRQTVAPSEVIVVVDHNPGLLGWVRGHVGGVTAVANGEGPGLAGGGQTGGGGGGGGGGAFLGGGALGAPAGGGPPPPPRS